MQDILQAVERQYLTKAQARLYTGLSERSLDYAKERGALSFIKLGKRVLFRKSDIDAWLEKHRVGVDLDQIVDEVLRDVAGK